MKKILQKYHKESSFKSSVKNFFFLGLFQVPNYLFPLITIPYLTRVIGIEKIGIVFIAQALVSIFSVITDYGFNLTATRDIAIHRKNKIAISEIVSSIYILKTLIAIFCLIIYISLVWIIKDLREHFLLFVFSYAIVVAQILIPSWLLQGMGIMKLLVYVNGISKFINLALILFFVRSTESYYLVNLFYGAGGILTGIYIILWLKHKKLISFFIPSNARIYYYFKDSWNTFLSAFSINTYTNTNILILKLFADPVTVGYYGIAEKVLYVLRNLLAVFFQAIYPQASQQSKVSHVAFKKVIFDFFPIFLFVLVLISFLVFFFAPSIIMLISGSIAKEAIYLLRILIVIPIIVAFNMPAFQSLLVYNLKMAYSRIFLIAVPLSIGMNFIGAYLYGASGTAWAVLLTEVFITLGLIYTLEYKFPRYSVYQLHFKKG